MFASLPEKKDAYITVILPPSVPRQFSRSLLKLRRKDFVWEILIVPDSSRQEEARVSDVAA
ncbi:MAG: hypothetical protein C4532_00680 [Candidatus Abyssobacteria bacterium SURF_17]|jgi:hypothetical protein|uniref:Glycosyltransferase family 2 protein n=1 Tax=Candidatus Abyssobacteria bacterium SURF_17 TaxID=2093361 RepID=A0A419F9A6_9BACT|nr:MAG: hypothetical protein C4532_00680 [Candidatus Abyssubacteria bacterium SURF_17]